jgi:adenine-specific DNA-methyltransferase
MNTAGALANTDTYARLQATLRELFQLDQADLDFGIYRILNQRRTQVEAFLDTLPDRVREALTSSTSSAQEDIRRELAQLENTLRGAGVDPDTNAKVLELRAQLGGGASMEALENEVFSLLANFFKRYYQQGDFISLRRYKKDVYAIPYEGEEVKLHWANHDQYYIKTGEYFKQYRFAVPGGKWVHFELKEASTETANNKAAAGKERRFRLCEKDFLQVEGDTLRIFFVYEALETKTGQDELLKEAFERLAPALPAAFQSELLRPMPTDKQKDRTLLHKRLKDYTARNTFDYFIHKNLGGFLRRELDFFIKNEVLLLDDLHLHDERKYAAQLRTVRALKAAANPVIQFLAQLEDFQKKLWLKKKFVVETQWCITLDRVPQELYPEIAANEAQRQAWVELFKIEELPGYSTPLTIDFLKANPYLVLDTQFFAASPSPGEKGAGVEGLRDRLLASIENLDEQTDGLLIHSENFQALQLLQERYKQQVKCVYIDPPYNTGPSEILYLNNYKHASWICLMENRLGLGKLLHHPEEYLLTVAIDDFEVSEVHQLLKRLYPQEELDVVVVNHHPQGGYAANITRTHEYGLFVTPLGKDVLQGKVLEEGEEDRPFMRSGTGDNNFRSGRPNSFFAVLVDPATFRVVRAEPPPTGNDYPRGFTEDGLARVYPIGGNGQERVWRSAYESAVEAIEKGLIVASRSLTIYQAIDRTGQRLPVYSNWTDKRYNAGTHGTNLIRDILGAAGLFSYPKSLYTVVDTVDSIVHNDKSALVLDYFGGSGTTGHAVIELNRGDGGLRKWLMVEMGEYYETVTKPRMQKVVYSRKWKDGKPEGREGISQCFKTIRLESYEDVLNNLVLGSAKPELFQGAQGFNEDTLLHYALDVESRESLLNVRHFADPFNYRLKITRHNELREERIDLVETFNFLIGLVVQHRAWVSGYHVVTGALLTGEKVLVIWRNTNEKDNLALEDFFKKRQYNPRDTEFDLIYVNGDNTLENLRTGTEHWKVRLIEEEFLKRMWECKDV